MPQACGYLSLLHWCLSAHSLLMLGLSVSCECHPPPMSICRVWSITHAVPSSSTSRQTSTKRVLVTVSESLCLGLGIAGQWHAHLHFD